MKNINIIFSMSLIIIAFFNGCASKNENINSAFKKINKTTYKYPLYVKYNKKEKKLNIVDNKVNALDIGFRLDNLKPFYVDKNLSIHYLKENYKYSDFCVMKGLLTDKEDRNKTCDNFPFSKQQLSLGNYFFIPFQTFFTLGFNLLISFPVCYNCYYDEKKAKIEILNWLKNNKYIRERVLPTYNNSILVSEELDTYAPLLIDKKSNYFVDKIKNLFPCLINSNEHNISCLRVLYACDNLLRLKNIYEKEKPTLKDFINLKKQLINYDKKLSNLLNINYKMNDEYNKIIAEIFPYRLSHLDELNNKMKYEYDKLENYLSERISLEKDLKNPKKNLRYFVKLLLSLKDDYLKQFVTEKIKKELITSYKEVLYFSKKEKDIVKPIFYKIAQQNLNNYNLLFTFVKVYPDNKDILNILREINAKNFIYNSRTWNIVKWNGQYYDKIYPTGKGTFYLYRTMYPPKRLSDILSRYYIEERIYINTEIKNGKISSGSIEGVLKLIKEERFLFITTGEKEVLKVTYSTTFDKGIFNMNQAIGLVNTKLFKILLSKYNRKTTNSSYKCNILYEFCKKNKSTKTSLVGCQNAKENCNLGLIDDAINEACFSICLDNEKCLWRCSKTLHNKIK